MKGLAAMMLSEINKKAWTEDQKHQPQEPILTTVTRRWGVSSLVPPGIPA
jgi:hypothetical protein